LSRSQRTIREPVELEGRGLFNGRKARVTLLPASAGRGIVFVRADRAERPEIPALASSVADRSRWTGLQAERVEVRMVEHLLSAAYGLGVDNLVVETWGEEIPIGDGSAKTYVELLLRAGIETLEVPVVALDIREPVRVREENATLTALPNPAGLKVTYTLDYGDRFVGRQTLTLDINETTYVESIAPARTYVLRPEIQAFLEQGLGSGASAENLLIVDEDGSIEGDRRYQDECVRHKIVDMLGDLSLIGRPLNAHMVGYRSGHTTNHELAQRLREGLSRVQSV